LECSRKKVIFCSPEPEISFTTDSYVVVENELEVEVCLMLNVPLATDLSVTLTSRESGSATGGKETQQ